MKPSGEVSGRDPGHDTEIMLPKKQKIGPFRKKNHSWFRYRCWVPGWDERISDRGSQNSKTSPHVASRLDASRLHDGGSRYRNG